MIGQSLEEALHFVGERSRKKKTIKRMKGWSKKRKRKNQEASLSLFGDKQVQESVRWGFVQLSVFCTSAFWPRQGALRFFCST